MGKRPEQGRATELCAMKERGDVDRKWVDGTQGHMGSGMSEGDERGRVS